MLPINGRVAIVDDQYEQVKVLIDSFSKQQIPFRYYDGTLDSLPEEGAEASDFRLLFMDLHLSEADTSTSDKNLKSNLISVLQRLIPKNNYPYIFVYWSRHAGEHKSFIEEDVFEDDLLKNKKPIAYIDAQKSDFYDLNGEPKTDPLGDIVDRIKSEVVKYPAYQSLLEWENIVHQSADKTIQELFKLNGISGDEWSKASLDLFTLFSKASLGGKKMEESSPQQKIKSSLSVLNNLLIDTLENGISKQTFIEYELNQADTSEHIDNNQINFKLLIDSNNVETIKLKSPGAVVKIADNSNLEAFTNNILNNHFISRVCEEEDSEFKTKSKTAQKKAISDKRNTLRQESFLVRVCVDPVCDYVQGKVEHSRLVDGVMLQDIALDFIDTRSEANFISPVFKCENKNYFLVINFKHLKTIEIDVEDDPTIFTPIFRIRQQMLAEIQSKLARHISRQGILSI